MSQRSDLVRKRAMAHYAVAAASRLERTRVAASSRALFAMLTTRPYLIRREILAVDSEFHSRLDRFVMPIFHERKIRVKYINRDGISIERLCQVYR